MIVHFTTKFCWNTSISENDTIMLF